MFIGQDTIDSPLVKRLFNYFYRKLSNLRRDLPRKGAKKPLRHLQYSALRVAKKILRDSERVNLAVWDSKITLGYASSPLLSISYKNRAKRKRVIFPQEKTRFRNIRKPSESGGKLFICFIINDL
jgi:hypothetical protein